MEKKKSTGRRKKVEERGHGVVEKKRREWFEREMEAKAAGFACMNNEASSSSKKEMYNSGNKVAETCEASGLCWDMRMGEIYWDEEELFNMPTLINSMAEGLLITPPALQTGFNWLPPETPFHFTLWAD